MGGNCYTKNKERGAWFELLNLRRVIQGKESRGIDAGWEKGLLKAWLEFPEYKKADKELTERGLILVTQRQDVNLPMRVKENHGLSDVNPSDFEITKNDGVVLKHPGGRPSKTGDNISRSTRWRREKATELLRGS